MEQTVEAVRHRLFEEVTKEAFSPRPTKERSEARRMLANNLIPEMKKVVTEHRFVVEAPAKIPTVEEWQRIHAPQPPILEAEVIHDGEKQRQGEGQAPQEPPASESAGAE